MADGQKYRLRNPGVKRLMREAVELAQPTDEFFASPLEDNLFEWHFTARGPPDTDFHGGYYHGRIILPTAYPMQPPNIILLTPNGRFEIDKKICLSISGYHPETWQPSWSIRTAVMALIAFMPTTELDTLGALDYTPEERRLLARKSKDWVCPICGRIADKLTAAAASSTSTAAALTKDESSLLEQISFKVDEGNSAERNDSMEPTVVGIQQENGAIRTDSEMNPSSITHSVQENQTNDSKSLLQLNEDLPWTVVTAVLICAIFVLVIRRLMQYLQ